jgi:hypothetical protein
MADTIRTAGVFQEFDPISSVLIDHFAGDGFIGPDDPKPEKTLCGRPTSELMEVSEVLNLPSFRAAIANETCFKYTCWRCAVLFRNKL